MILCYRVKINLNMDRLICDMQGMIVFKLFFKLFLNNY